MSSFSKQRGASNLCLKRLRYILLVVWILASLSLTLGCGGGEKGEKIVKENVSMRSWIEAEPNANQQTIWVEVENVGEKDDITVDAWANVLPGMKFIAQRSQEVTEDGTQVSRLNLPIRPGGSVQIPFVLEIEPTVEVGTHIIYTFVRYRNDVLQQKLSLQVGWARR